MRRLIFAALAWLVSSTVALPMGAYPVQVYVSIASQQMVVKEKGKTKYVWAVSTGTSNYETPRGSFQSTGQVRDYYSDTFEVPMPYSVFFYRPGYAIHATSATRKLGRPASHGCVRLAPGNAKKLFALVQKYGPRRTLIVIR